MVIDTSAFLAIVGDEPERHHFNSLIATDPASRTSAGSWLETMLVVEARYGREGVRDARLLVSTGSIDVVAFDEEQAMIAADAYSRFGKGRHPAALNFGDCFAYALAMQLGEPLLFKGDDFPLTDVQSVLHS